MKLADYAIKKPATIIISLVGILLFGFLSFSGMKQDLITTITLPRIMVYCIYPGASPTDIEQAVVNPFEKVMASVSGVNKLESDCMKSVGFVTATCDWDVNLNQMKTELESVIESVTLPDSAFPPVVRILNSNLLPIISFKVEPGKIISLDPKTGEQLLDEAGKPIWVTRELTPLQITQYLENNVVPQFQKILGVSQVSIKGGSYQEVCIRLDMDRCQSTGVTPLRIYTILSYSNMNLPAGNVYHEGRFLNFRTQGKFDNIDDIRDMVIDFKESDKTFIKLRDVAEVDIVDAPKDHYVEWNKEPIIVLEVEKLPTGDTIKIIDKVKKIIDNTVVRSGNLLSFEPILDSSKDIGAAVNGVANSAITGVIFVFLVIFIFLQNIRTTLIIGTSIPLSVIIAFCCMKLAGLNINLMTLGGMTVAIGMIVDSSIVILENTWNLFLKSGDAKAAASEGADEVGGAVIASIMTTLVVFLPILTLSGLVGAILTDVSMTIVFALAGSLIVSIMVVPFMCSLLLKMPDKTATTKTQKLIEAFGSKVGYVLDKIDGFYEKLIKSALLNKNFVLICAVLILILSFLTLGLVGFEFLDAPDMGEFEIVVKTPSGFSMEETREKLRLLNDELNDILGANLKSGQFLTGSDPTYPINGIANSGAIRLRLIDAPSRSKGMSIFDVIPMLQEELPKRVPGVDITVNNGGLAAMLSFATGGSGFVVEVSGKDFDEISKVALEISRHIQEHPKVYKTQMNVNLDEKELISKLDLAGLGSVGISPFEAAASELIVFQGMRAGNLLIGDDEYEIRVTSNLEKTNLGEDTLTNVPLQSQKGGTMLSMAVVSKLEEKSSADRIPHVNKMRSITITGLVSDGSDIAKDMRPILETVPLPAGVEWEIGGSSSLLADALGDLLVVMGVAIFLVYAVMVIQFQKFTQPLIVMTSIPFVFIGVAISLLLSSTNISLVAMLAVIALIGTVINNAIVLIDYTNLLREKYGQPLYDAVVNSGRSRLKPILMTTLTTALGVVPMFLSRAEGNELLKPLGLVIAGGLLTSTAVTLILVPVIYYVVESKRDSIKTRLSKTDSSKVSALVSSGGDNKRKTSSTSSKKRETNKAKKGV